MKIIAIASGKGGVGKSTITCGLAMAMQQQGLNTCILDADVYGPSQHILLNVGKDAMMQSPDNKHFVPLDVLGLQLASVALILSPEQRDNALAWRAPLAIKLIRQLLGYVKWKKPAVLLIDLPPGTGDIPLTIMQHGNLNGAIIVTTRDNMALSIAKKSVLLLKQMQLPLLGIVENMSYFNCMSCGHENYFFQEEVSNDKSIISKIPFFDKENLLNDQLPSQFMTLAQAVLKII